MTSPSPSSLSSIGSLRNGYITLHRVYSGEVDVFWYMTTDVSTYIYVPGCSDLEPASTILKRIKTEGKYSRGFRHELQSHVDEISFHFAVIAMAADEIEQSHSVQYICMKLRDTGAFSRRSMHVSNPLCLDPNVYPSITEGEMIDVLISPQQLQQHEEDPSTSSVEIEGGSTSSYVGMMRCLVHCLGESSQDLKDRSVVRRMKSLARGSEYTYTCNDGSHLTIPLDDIEMRGFTVEGGRTSLMREIWDYGIAPIVVDGKIDKGFVSTLISLHSHNRYFLSNPLSERSSRRTIDHIVLFHFLSLVERLILNGKSDGHLSNALRQLPKSSSVLKMIQERQRDSLYTSDESCTIDVRTQLYALMFLPLTISDVEGVWFQLKKRFGVFKDGVLTGIRGSSNCEDPVECSLLMASAGRFVSSRDRQRLYRIISDTKLIERNLYRDHLPPSSWTSRVVECYVMSLYAERYVAR